MFPLLALLVLAFASSVIAAGPEFEVASIKQLVTPTNNQVILVAPASGGPGTDDPTHMTMPAMSLRNLALIAFDVKTYQLVGLDDNERYDFSVVIPNGATKEDVKFMWRNLLISRFGLKYHIEQREFQVDELTLGPKGHKLTENTEPEPPSNARSTLKPGQLKIDKNGRPLLDRPATITMTRKGPNGLTTKLVGRAQPVSALATALSGQLEHPVVDKTGLTSKYDFFTEFAPSGNGGKVAPGAIATNSRADAPSDLIGAVQQQLGLRLVKGRGKLDVVVVDKIDRVPTEN